MQLRDYQQRTLDQLYAWFASGNDGNPCIVLPTGAGKSHVIAAFCCDALQQWPETRILMLTHVRELIAQNLEKLRQHWPDAPVGVYSAGMGCRQIGEPITFAGIQSVRDKADELGHVDICLIDESHLCNHADEGGYRKLINALHGINPSMRVIGLTATPYRLGHGLITDKPAIFDALIEPVSIAELIAQGYLSTLRSKSTEAALDASGVHKRGGEYIANELQDAVNTPEKNSAVVREVISRAGDRKAWLFFCAGVEHAEAVALELSACGIVAECVTGATSLVERERILDGFKIGQIRALTNANVLTTGFDHPGIDLIAMLRPTMSPGLYVQMAGRGLRISPDKTDCLVLDFAGVVAQHGPITAVKPPKKAKEGDGEAPVKVCSKCGEIVHAAVRICPACDTPFPEPVRPALKLRDDDIMGIEPLEMAVTGWRWQVHTSKASGLQMLKCTYYGALSDEPVTEYFTVCHPGQVGRKAREAVLYLLHVYAGQKQKDGWDHDSFASPRGLEATVELLDFDCYPTPIRYKKDGKFFRVLQRGCI